MIDDMAVITISVPDPDAATLQDPDGVESVTPSADSTISIGGKTA